MSKIIRSKSIAVLSILTATISIGFAIPTLADTANPIGTTSIQLDPKPSPQPPAAPTQDNICGPKCMKNTGPVSIGEQNPSKSPRRSFSKQQRYSGFKATNGATDRVSD
jgi:hypothetical protein